MWLHVLAVFSLLLLGRIRLLCGHFTFCIFIHCWFTIELFIGLEYYKVLFRDFHADMFSFLLDK